MNPDTIEICDTDNRRARRYKQPISAEIFWARIQRPIGCWLYDGAKETNGYGYLSNPFAAQPKFITAHRAAWIFANGSIPEGMRVLHKCDVRACVNPNHLFLGTDADNRRDMLSKGRDFSRLLTAQQAREIKDALKHLRPGLQTELAKKYNVSRNVIHKIRKGRSYKEVE